MINVSRCALSFAAVMSMALVARAGNLVEPGNVELYPTYSAVGIEVSYAGDDHANATASFVWRKSGEKDWRNGVDMTLDRSRRLVWASVWPLEQGETVEVKVSFEDPGAGLALAPLTGQITVRKMVLENSGGAKYFVSPSGDDSGTGAMDKPFRTLGHVARLVTPGDTVYAMTGVYNEGNLFGSLKGEPGRPIIFAAAEGAKPVIDGSVVIEKGGGAWEEIKPGIYSADLVLTAGQARYAAQDGLRMFYYRSLEALDKDELGARRAWFYDEEASKVYLKTGDAGAPGEHVYNVAAFTCGVWLAGSEYVVVRGFEIRHCGETCVAVTDGSLGCIIYDNDLHNAPGAVNIAGETVHDTAVWRNRMYEKGLTDFTWNAIKASEYRRQGLTCFSGRGSSMCYNHVDGYFDCIDPEVWNFTERIDLNRDLDVMFNDLVNSGDDAIEADGGGVNYRIHGNRIRNCFAAISIAPVEKGPVYVTRNDASYKMIMFKLNVGGPESLGWAYCYQNSGYCQITGAEYGGTGVSFPPAETLPISNKVFKNNAVICKGEGIRCAHSGYVLDYDCYWTVPGAKPVGFSWQKQTADGGWLRTNYPTLGEFTAASGRETHGLYADPLFVSTPDVGTLDWYDYGAMAISAYPLVENSAIGDLRLRDGSPCIDAGVVIRGINEDYKGKAPDIGAFEMK